MNLRPAPEIYINAVIEEELLANRNVQLSISKVQKKQVRWAWDTLNVRQKEVVKATKHAWTGYKKFAWGHDHLRPITMKYDDWFHLGLTIVDSLDTLFMMNLTSGIRKELQY